MNCPSPFARIVQHLSTSRLREPLHDASEAAMLRWRRAQGKLVDDTQVDAIRRARLAGRTLRSLAEEFRLSKAGVWSICSGRTRRQPEATA